MEMSYILPGSYFVGINKSINEKFGNVANFATEIFWKIPNFGNISNFKIYIILILFFPKMDFLF